jgi:capsular exopolysaccharide synthesis family protein
MASPPPPPVMDYDSEMFQERNLREYFHVLLKRKWTIIVTFLSIFLMVALYTFIRTPIFRASANLQITEDNPGARVSADERITKYLTSSESEDKFMQTQYKILQSWSLAHRVVKAMNLAEHPQFKFVREMYPEKSQGEIENAVATTVLPMIEVTPTKNSYLVEVAFQSSDKTLAQKVVNAIADEYMYLSIDRRNESFALVRKWLDQQLQEMAAKVQEAQKKLFKFGQQTDIYTLEDKDNVVVKKFIDLSELLTKAQAEKMAKEAQYQQIKDKGPNAPIIVNHPLVSQLRQHLVAQQAKVSAMKKVYRAEHPELQAESANLAEMQGRLQGEVLRLQESVKADFEAANRTEKLLKDSFSAQKDQMAKLQDNLTDYQILKRDAQTNEQLYQALLARVKEANIAGTMVPSNVAVIDSALLPESPYKPKKVRDLAIAVILGLTLGVGLAFLMEHLDDSIKSVDDMERSCSLPSLGMVPLLGSNGIGHQLEEKGVRRYLPRLRQRNQALTGAEDMELMVYKHPQSLATEAIRHTCTSIMLSVSGRPPCIIMVTSPNPSEGKTVIASNLAQAFALDGRQTVLIDCDLRKPRQHRIFQVDNQPGLSKYLTGGADLEEILHPTAISDLVVIPAGARPPSPGILLNSEIFKDLLLQLRQRFNHIIIDTPPILGFTDARIISVLTDGVLLVTKHHVTHKSAGRLAHQLLNQIHAPIMGCVLNCVDSHGQAYGGYYYHYHYKYYSKYYGDKSGRV